LRDDFGVTFDRLFTIANMPINRFRSDLEAHGELDAYMQKLGENFNHAVVADVMCRDLISVGWDGRLYDCDFNQMLEMPLAAGARTLDDFDAAQLAERQINTAVHCLGCTAGCGSSCGGALS